MLTLVSNQSSSLKINTSNNKIDCMVTSPDSPDIPTYTSKLSTPKLDKAVEKIQKLKSIPQQIPSPIDPKTIPRGTQTTTSTLNENDPKLSTQLQHTAEQQQLQPIIGPQLPNNPRRNECNEEHNVFTTCSGKSSISEIKPIDFNDEELYEKILFTRRGILLLDGD